MYLSCDSSVRRGFDRDKGEYMFQHVNKSGISFDQAKKDAKKLSNSENIPLNQAQDRIAFHHARSTWAEAVEQSKRKFSYTLPDIEQVLLNEKASFTEVRGASGSGKTSFIFHVIEQFLRQGIRVNLMTYGTGFRMNDERVQSPHEVHSDCYPKCGLSRMLFEYGSLVNILDIEYAISLDDFTLSGGPLFIDEGFCIWRTLKERGLLQNLTELLRASKHTFVTEMGVMGEKHTFDWNVHDAEESFVQFYASAFSSELITSDAVMMGQFHLFMKAVSELRSRGKGYSECYYGSSEVPPKLIKIPYTKF